MQRKRLVQVLCFTLLFLSAPVQAEEVTGFRGMNWGDPLPKEGMTFVGKDKSYGGVDKYTRARDSLKIGAAELKSIVYAYWNGRLCIVDITSAGCTNFTSLLDAFKEKFGEPFQENKYIKHYIWTDSPKTIISIEYKPINEFTRALMVSIDINNEQRKWNIEQAKKGKNDF